MLKKIIKIFLLVLMILLVSNYKMVLKNVFPNGYEEHVEKYSKEYNLDKNLVYSIIKVESNFNQNAVSRKGASGLMQITPDTSKYIGKLLGIKDSSSVEIFDVETNIRFGCFYFSKLYKDFGGDLDCALAAYNGGEGNLRKWLNIYTDENGKLDVEKIPFEETRNYIKKVKKIYSIYKYLY